MTTRKSDKIRRNGFHHSNLCSPDKNVRKKINGDVEC